jgi:hypothetical protein
MYECSLNREMSSTRRSNEFVSILSRTTMAADENDVGRKAALGDEREAVAVLVCIRVRYYDSLSDGRRRSVCVCRAD